MALKHEIADLKSPKSPKHPSNPNDMSNLNCQSCDYKQQDDSLSNLSNAISNLSLCKFSIDGKNSGENANGRPIRCCTYKEKHAVT